MTFPTAPQTVASFFSAQPPTVSEVGAQFDEFKRSIAEILGFLKTFVREDGKLLNSSIEKEQISPEIGQKIVLEATRALEHAFSRVKDDALEARSASYDVHAVLDHVQALKNEIEGARASIFALFAEFREKIEFFDQYVAPHLHQGGERPAAHAPYAGMLWPQAGGFYAAGDTLGAAAVAQDYAEVAIQWAEHMPDTIPPNILAINAITGDHWSSRWWANKSAGAFGMMAALYCGASPTDPSQTLTGDPLTPGCLYFNTTSNSMLVWNGTSWQPFTRPQKAFTASLYYLATAGQTSFPLTTLDLYGNAYALDPRDTEGIEIHVNGVLLTPDDNAAMPTGDYFVDVVNSTVVLKNGAPLSAIIAIDILQGVSHLTPGAVAITPLTNINTPPGTQDGVATLFNLTVKSDGSIPNIAGAEELLVSLDGVIQEPGVNYVASAGQINFSQAPASDAYVFISWMKTPLNNPPNQPPSVIYYQSASPTPPQNGDVWITPGAVMFVYDMLSGNWLQLAGMSP